MPSPAATSTLDAVEPSFGAELRQQLVSALSRLAVPLGAGVLSLLLFGVFIALAGAPPLEVYSEMVRGSVGSWFSFQNTLLRAAPLMLTGLCTALPARLGLIVIGGEGALVVGGVAAASVTLLTPTAPSVVMLSAMTLAAITAGAVWVGLAGALRAYRGVNETISSLLLTYVGIALMNHLVEGALRDPASLNKPSTPHIGEANMIGAIPGMDVHWGLAVGIGVCLAAGLLMNHTTFGFAGRIVGGNTRAAQLSGVRVRELIVIVSCLAGACAGLAGMLEVAAIHGRANASLVTGYGYTGILVAFLARHNPIAVIPVALLLGGISASGGLLQRSFGLPDATVNVLQGILFVVLLASETWQDTVRRLVSRLVPSA